MVLLVHCGTDFHISSKHLLGGGGGVITGIDSSQKCFKVHNTHSLPRYRRIIANTSIGAAILFLHHPYIGTH